MNCSLPDLLLWNITWHQYLKYAFVKLFNEVVFPLYPTIAKFIIESKAVSLLMWKFRFHLSLKVTHPNKSHYRFDIKSCVCRVTNSTWNRTEMYKQNPHVRFYEKTIFCEIIPATNTKLRTEVSFLSVQLQISLDFAHLDWNAFWKRKG